MMSCYKEGLQSRRRRSQTNNHPPRDGGRASMNVGGPEGFGSGVFEMDSAGLRTWAKRAIFGACIIVPAAALLWYFVFSARTTPNQQPDPPVRVVTVVMRPV